MLKCNACGKFMTANECVSCPKCKGKSHRACVNIAEGAKIPPSWLCPECKARTPKTGNLSTPVRGQGVYHSDDSQDGETQTDIVQAVGIESQDSGLINELRLFRDEMRQTRQELKNFRQEMLEIRVQIQTCEGRLDRLETKISELDSRNNQVCSETDNLASVQTIISGLQQELNNRDQELLLTDLEVAGIPEETEENLLHVVTTCAAKLNICLEERDIVSCSRVGGIVRGEQSGGPRSRPIAVRLARKAVRDSILHAARVRRSLTTEGIGLRHPVVRPFYINERLTKTNRVLFFKVRERTKQLAWRYAWTKDGKIFVRREPGTAAFRIRSEADLDRVFGKVNVRPKEQS